MHTPTRRTILSGIATAGTATLAGCQTTPSTSAAQFDSVTTDGTALVIELDSASEIDQLTVIDPDGSAFTEVEATAGQTRYSIDIGTAYTPGEYELNTVTDGDITATEAIDIQPDVEITGVGVGANHPDKMPDSLGRTKDVECYVNLVNTGKGPTAIQRLSFSGDVPHPTVDEGGSGIYDSESGGGEAQKLVFESNEERTIYSSTLPFSFEGDGVDCESKVQNGGVTVNVGFSNISNVTTTFEVRYPAADTYDGCTPEILEGE